MSERSSSEGAKWTKLKDVALTDQTLYITLCPLNVSLEGITQTTDDSWRTAATLVRSVSA